MSTTNETTSHLTTESSSVLESKVSDEKYEKTSSKGCCSEKNIFTPRTEDEASVELKYIKDYNTVMQLLIKFFTERGFHLCPTQEQLSLLAACEDPKTVTTFNYQRKIYSMIQTGQMTMEAYYLTHKQALDKCFCISTSYRQEPKPVEGRHKLVFTLFEFEFGGDFEDLLKLKSDLFKFLGFKVPEGMDDFPRVRYLDACEKYGTKELDHAEEEKLYRDYGDVVFLTHFPKEFSYWNMKLSDEDKRISLKCDSIAGGQESIGAAERATSVDEMRQEFYAVEDGAYAQMMFDRFPETRVKKELDDYLSLPFSKRAGAGIGVFRIMQAMRRAGLL